MAVNDDAVAEEAAGANTRIDVEDGLHVQSRFIPPEELSTDDEAPASPFSSTRNPTSKRRLYLMVLADFGLAFTWLSKFAVATPYFQHTLKAGPFLSHLVWIMGPLSGLIVAPVVGVLSDRCTWSFGRRRPFILGGMIACIFGMNVFANATTIAFGFLPAARWIAFFAFGVLDFSTNAIMFPSRALMGDLLPPEEQHSVQSAAAVVASLAELCAGAYIYTWRDPVTHVARIFSVASVILVITCSVSLFMCHEEPLRPKDAIIATTGAMPETSSTGVQIDIELNNIRSSPDLEDEKSKELLEEESAIEEETRKDGEFVDDSKSESAPGTGDEEDDDENVENRLASSVSEERAPTIEESVIRDEEPVQTAAGGPVWGELVGTVKEAIMMFPRPLIKVGVVYGLAWFVWFASLPFYSQWLGVNVLGGDPTAEAGTPEALRYQSGVSYFSIANAAKAVLALIFSAYYPNIIRWVGAIGERVVFGASFFAFSSILYACAYTKNVMVAGSVIALGAVPFIVTQTIPVAIVVQRFPENLASNLGVLNLFCVIPQLIDTLYTGEVAAFAGESAVLRVAALWGFAAAVAAVFLL